MRTFACPACATTVFFTNASCATCMESLAYDVVADRFLGNAKRCRSSSRATESGLPCNWVSFTADGWCRSCQLDIHHEDHELGGPFQDAKRRTMRQLIRFNVDPSAGSPALGFDLGPSTGDVRVMTGHAEGLITIDIAEADPVTLAEVQEQFGEPYRMRASRPRPP